MPCANQLDMMWLATPEPISRSPSVEMMQRAQDGFFLRARIGGQITAIGVRDRVEPPIPTVAPSFTNEAASSRLTTFSRNERSRLSRLSRRVSACWTEL